LALGGRSVDHDVTKLAGKRLRSHGSIAEQTVPFIVSRPLNDEYAARARGGLRNFDIFEYAINGTN
jgi:phosphonoacetate hydrolase